MLLVVSLLFSAKNIFAGPPLINLEGAGGIALNPLAYLADSDGENSHLKIGETGVLGKPRFGIWYISLSEVNVDWTAAGFADTFFKRLEVSYGYETINQENTTAKHKNNVGAKLLLLAENSFNNELLPAISIGSIWKHTSNLGDGVDDTDVDHYIVATKLINVFSRQVLFSGGLLSTKGKATGVFGFAKEREVTGFGNIEVVLPKNLIIGYEYKQGAHYSDWKDANYWNAHVAWTPNKELTLVLAYVNAGNQNSTSRVGLGDGVVLSAQYAF